MSQSSKTPVLPPVLPSQAAQAPFVALGPSGTSRSVSEGKIGASGKPSDTAPKPAGASAAQRVPPQDIESEMATLGAFLLDAEDCLARLDGERVALSAKDFYRLAHGTLFAAILALVERREPVDVVTLKAELVRRGELESCGGALYLMQLAEFVPTTASVAHYARKVVECATLRRLIETASEIAALAYAGSESVAQLASKAETAILGATVSVMGGEAQTSRPIKELIGPTWDRICARFEQGGGIKGLPGGIPEVDALLSGYQPGKLYLLAARPGMGKTSLAFLRAINVALGWREGQFFPENGKPVLVFSTEMTQEEAVERMIGTLGCVDSYAIQEGRMGKGDMERFQWASQLLYEAALEIDDESSLTVPAMRSRARRFKRRMGGCGLIVVDYAQRLLPDPSKRYNGLREETVDMAKALKSLAREMQCPVLALAQLSRGVERREDKRPTLSDLAESGQLEAEADVVEFIYRPEYYRRKEFGEAVPEAEEAELLFEKNRGGRTGVTIKVKYAPAFTRFDALPDGWSQTGW